MTPHSPTIAATDAAGRLALLQAGLDLVNQGFTIIDAELRLVAWNRTFFTMLEFPDALARFGTPFEAFMRYNAERGEYGPGEVEQLVATRVEAARTFQPHYFERVRPNGQIIAVRGEPVPQRGFVTIYTDISEQRRQESLIREQNAELERRVAERTAAYLAEHQRAQTLLVQGQKMEAVGQLAGGLAHDFNNMLTVVIGNLSALEERVSAEQRDFLEPALLAARRGVELIRRLLTFARQQPLAPRPVDVGALIHSLVLLLRRSLPENIALETRLRHEPLFALVDPHQLESALLNLALNARDALAAGGSLVIEAERQSVTPQQAEELQLAPGDYAAISVADDGSGMDAATLARACEPFFTTKGYAAGSGLGLSMVYGYARQSGGALRLDSAPGTGTRAQLLLPLSVVTATAEAEDAGPATARAERPLVLLVEDDAEVRRVLRLQLTDLGYPVIEAEDGAEALRTLDAVEAIGILVSDMVMPGGMDGQTLARRARQARPGLRVLLVSAYADGLASTAADLPLLAKPVSKRELATALEKL